MTATGGDAKYKNGGAVDDSVLSAILPLATVGSQNYLVLDADLAASGISAANGAAIVLDGKTEADTQARSSIDILAAQFAIGASFPHTPRAALTVGSPSGENKQGDVFAVAADNASFSEPDRALFTDAQGRLTVALANGQLAWDGLYAVSFKDGEAILRSNSGLIYGEPVLPPPASEMKREDGANADLHIYTFLGWSLDPECGAESFGASGSSDIPAGQTTLSVTGNAVYHAIFAQTPRQIAILFTGIKDTNGDSLPDVQGSASIGGTLADAGLYPIANAPQDYPSGGYAYRFVGWRIGSSAFNQVWDPGEIGTKLILDYKISGASQGLVTMEAYYAKVGAAQSLVTFKVDYMLSAYAVNKTSAPTYRGASGTTTTVPTKIAAVSGTSYSFKGWYKGKSIVATGDVNYTPSASLPVAESDAVYTARFEESLAKYNITYVYHWKSGETGSFVLNYVDVVSTASGSDPFASLKPSDFKQDGLVYTFLGWSTRQGDKTPLFMGDGPAVTAAARYYAIYTSAPYTVSVTFKSGDEICAAAENVTPGQQSVTALFADTKASEPAAPSGKIFRGWSATANGTSWITGIIEITENQTYYAVFTNPDPKTVTFYDEDKSSVIKRILVDEHSAVADSGKAPTTPWKNGCWFTGWLDIAFKPFKLQTEIIARDTDLYASYAPIEKNVEAGSGAVADLGSTSLVLPGIEDATGVRFDLLLLQSADGDISGKAKEDGYAVLTTYRAALSYSTAGSSAGPLSILPLNIPVSGPVFGVLAADGTINPLAAEPGNPILSDFGSVKLVLPVTDTAVSKAKVYYLKLDGSVGVSDEKTVTGGKIEFTLTGYSLARADRGNLAVAALKAADKTDDPDKTNTEEKTLKDAIAAAQGQLKEQYEKYDKTKYTSGNWLGLVSEYETARIAIGNATTASAIQAQLLGGVSAMGAVPTGTLSSSAGSTTDTSDATEAELTSSAGTGTSGSALSSSATGSALSSSASAGLLASGAGLSGSDVKSDADKLEEKYLEALRIADIADAYKSYGEGFVWPIGDPGDDISNLRLYIRAFAEREAEFNARDDANKPAEAKAAIKRCADGISKYADALAAYIASPDDPAVQSSLRSAGKELVSAYENMKSVLDGLPEEEVEDEQEDGVTTVALTETPKSPPAIDDSGLSNEAKTGFSQWVKTHIALACIIGIVILAAIAALVWWLLRRRNRLAAEGVDAPTGGDGMDEDWVKLA
ncbi:MAG: InlB B-repeat-containing protein [Clostridiales Family XIII bacterium]|nr:InlB B-repeat-containing protein [Clostridiales Family XIII bacterium]